VEFAVDAIMSSARGAGGSARGTESAATKDGKRRKITAALGQK